MGSFIGNAIIWTLAIYGLFEIIKNIIYICTYTNMRSEGIYLILAVKNQENKIEGLVRTVLFRILYGKEENIKDIIIADLNSNDNTKEILEKLQEEYEQIKITDWKECKDIIDNIDKA